MDMDMDFGGPLIGYSDNYPSPSITYHSGETLPPQTEEKNGEIFYEKVYKDFLIKINSKYLGCGYDSKKGYSFEIWDKKEEYELYSSGHIFESQAQACEESIKYIDTHPFRLENTYLKLKNHQK